VDEVQALVGSGLADLRMTVAEVGNADPSRKIQQPSTILEFHPRSSGPNHDGVTSDPTETLRNVLGTNFSQTSRGGGGHGSRRFAGELVALDCKM
jgi:hypothetical protein